MLIVKALENQPFQTHSILNLGSTGYEGNFLFRVHLEYDYYEGLAVKVNISTIHVNTSFKHVVSHLDDLKIASLRISDVEHMSREQEWKRLYTSSHNTYSALVYVCLLLLAL
jgi:hypothetical protein